MKTLELSVIEEKLLKREMESLSLEIGKGMRIIREALEKYQLVPSGGQREGSVMVTPEDVAAFNEWARGLSIAGSFYYGGTWFTTGHPLTSGGVPDFLKRHVTAYAVGRFLESIENVQSIAGQQ